MKYVALSVLVLCSLAISQQSTTQPTNYVVVDSTGRVIGSVVGVGQGGHVTMVAITVHGKPLVVDTLRSGFQMTNGLLFTSTDCTGQAYLDASSSPFLLTAVSADNKLFAENGRGQAITVLSILDPTSGCVQTSFPLDNAAPAAAVVDLNVFRPPFRVRAN
jgi:hypothetical protein